MITFSSWDLATYSVSLLMVGTRGRFQPRLPKPSPRPHKYDTLTWHPQLQDLIYPLKWVQLQSWPSLLAAQRRVETLLLVLPSLRARVIATLSKCSFHQASSTLTVLQDSKVCLGEVPRLLQYDWTIDWTVQSGILHSNWATPQLD